MESWSSTDKPVPLPNLVLFPGLRSLICSSESIEETAFIISTIGEHLTSLHISLSPITPLQDVVDLGDLVIAASSKLKRVRDLRMDLAHAGVWGLASELEMLDYLHIDDSFATIAPLAKMQFFTLTSLALSVYEIEKATDHLQNLCFPSLRTVHVLIASTQFALHTQVANLISALATACPSDSLSSFSLKSSHNGPEHGPSDDPDDWILDGVEEPVRPEAFYPLFRFPHMRQVRIIANWVWQLDDAFVSQVADAWPELTELELDSHSYWDPISQVTLQGLEPLALKCPNLTTLGIVLVGIPPESTHANSTIRGRWNTALRELRVGRSSIESPALVAAYLSGLFPQLEAIHAKRTRSEFAAYWSRAEEILPAMAMVRQEERAVVSGTHYF